MKFSIADIELAECNECKQEYALLFEIKPNESDKSILLCSDCIVKVIKQIKDQIKL